MTRQITVKDPENRLLFEFSDEAFFFCSVYILCFRIVILSVTVGYWTVVRFVT